MHFLNPVYRSFDPPKSCNTPKELYKYYVLTECSRDSDSTEMFLKNYQPKNNTIGKQKAKEYWLSFWGTNQIYETKCEYFEKIRADYTYEVEKLKKKIWKRHVVKMAEIDLRFSYVRRESSPEMPSDFLDLKSYWKVEKIGNAIIANYYDHSSNKSHINRSLETVIEEFPEATEEISWAKRYLLDQVSPEEKENIPEKYLPQVKIFRQLLWERHLCFSEERDRVKKEREEDNKDFQKRHEEYCRKQNQKFIFIASILSATVAGIVFSLFNLEKKINLLPSSAQIFVHFPFDRFIALIEKLKNLTKKIFESFQTKPQNGCICGCGQIQCTFEATKNLLQPSKL